MQLDKLKIGAATALAGLSIAGGALFAGVPLVSAQTLAGSNVTSQGTLQARRGRECNVDRRFCLPDEHSNFRRYGNAPFGNNGFWGNQNDIGGSGADGSGLAVPGS